MVWGVCRRVLRNYHDAEDAFQATFLVFVRKAASITSRELLANWLYRVAYQTALKARATAARRKARERQMAEMPEPEEGAQDLWRDLQPFLDKELSRLPDKYRVPILLCDLEGKTRREAAEQLGCPEGTVAGRLARARHKLAKRLARHDLGVLSGALATDLAQKSLSDGPPASVVSSTIEAASLVAEGRATTVGLVSVKVAALTEGVLTTMLMTRIKAILGILLPVTLLGAGVWAGVWTCQTRAGERAAPQKAQMEIAGNPEVILFEWQQMERKPPVFLLEFKKVDKWQVEVREYQHHRGLLPNLWWQLELRAYQYHRALELAVKREVIQSVYVDALSPHFHQLKR
jgi:RNA polymerase sigma factor (sigma-70 family)